MQIIIPMSGFGERFRRAGYKLPKPLIEIEGKPMIAHVIDLFPNETNFIFICNENHLAHPGYRMKEILQHYCPAGKIISIPEHKLGPVHAVLQAQYEIDDTQPVVVNYCDFTCYWDWQNFKRFVAETECAGAIPAYKGFHPHTLGTTNYAYLQEMDGLVQAIQEKKPYTNNRMQEYASSGTYYFSSGALMKSAFKAAIEQNLTVGGEYYVSLTYQHLLAEKLPITVYPLQHFMQWGTPGDIAEYRRWSTTFRHILTLANHFTKNSAVIIPMGGLGKRFADEGYSLTKPLIPVSGQPMVLQATAMLPSSQTHVFVLRDDMPEREETIRHLKARYPTCTIVTSATLTGGQACSTLLGVEALESNSGSLTVGACDSGVIYNENLFKSLCENKEADVIVWGVRGHTNATRQPHMYSWVDTDKSGSINNISVKQPINNPSLDPIVLGMFTFRRKQDLENVIQRLIQRNGQVNGEFYLDSCINDALALGLSCHLFEVTDFLSWGTPNELRTFEYWQSCFHKWASHPYRLENDPMIPKDQVDHYKARYQKAVPTLPKVPT